MMHYIGLDVAKAKLDPCLLLDESLLKRKTKVVDNSTSGIAALLLWTLKHGVESSQLHVVMEGTGVYHELAALALSDAGVMVSIVNPAQVKDFGHGLAVRTKTDASDSAVLARYGALLKPKAWLPPSHEARALAALLARRDAITQDLQRERNRQEKASISQASVNSVQQSLNDSIDFLSQQLNKLQQEIDGHINAHPQLKTDMCVLQSIPAVGDKVGGQLLAVMHNHSFASAEQLAAYLGLVPVERQSGSSIMGRARLSKAGPARVRAVLFMAAIVAKQHNPHVKALYDRLLARGKSKMSALGAAMRKLVHLCFGVLKTQSPYQADYANLA
jgi:transposase